MSILTSPSRNLFECSTNSQDREQIFKQVVAVHECNVIPAEFIEGNVVESDTGDYRLIDFHDEDEEHTAIGSRTRVSGKWSPTLSDGGVMYCTTLGWTWMFGSPVCNFELLVSAPL